MHTFYIAMFILWGLSAVIMVYLWYASHEKDPMEPWPYNIPESEVMGG